MKERIFAQGFSAKRKYFENGGEIINVGIKVDDFVAFLMSHQNGEWLNLDIKDKKDGSGMYAELNTYVKK